MGLINTPVPHVDIMADCLKLRKPLSCHQIFVSARGIEFWLLRCLCCSSVCFLEHSLCADFSRVPQVLLTVCVHAYKLTCSSSTQFQTPLLLRQCFPPSQHLKLPVNKFVLNFSFASSLGVSPLLGHFYIRERLQLVCEIKLDKM